MDKYQLLGNDNQYHNIMNALPIPVIIHYKGQILFCNNEADHLLGIENKETFLFQSLVDFVHTDDKKHIFKEVTSNNSQFHFEVRIIRLNQEISEVEITSFPFIYRGILARFLICLDRTIHKKTHNALKNNIEFLETLIDTIPNPVFYKDKHGVYKGCNKVFADKIIGKSRDLIIGKKLLDLKDSIPDDLARLYYTQDLRLIENPGIQTYEAKVHCADGIIREYLFNKGTYNDAEGNVAGIVGVMSDITERNKYQQDLISYREQLRRLTSELLLTEERKRRKIAHDLHDSIGQTLAICKIKLGSLKSLLNSELYSTEVEELRAYIEQMILEIRSLTFEISLPVLYELGLKAAIEWLIDKTQLQYKIHFELSQTGEIEEMDESILVLLFSATRELILNIIKHSEAKNVWIELFSIDNIIKLRVKDDGIGFDASKIHVQNENKSGFGLFSIRERIELLGGTFSIESQQGNGVQVNIISPLKTTKEHLKRIAIDED